MTQDKKTNVGPTTFTLCLPMHFEKIKKSPSFSSHQNHSTSPYPLPIKTTRPYLSPLTKIHSILLSPSSIALLSLPWPQEPLNSHRLSFIITPSPYHLTSHFSSSSSTLHNQPRSHHPPHLTIHSTKVPQFNHHLFHLLRHSTALFIHSLNCNACFTSLTRLPCLTLITLIIYLIANKKKEKKKRYSTFFWLPVYSTATPIKRRRQLSILFTGSLHLRQLLIITGPNPLRSSFPKVTRPLSNRFTISHFPHHSIASPNRLRKTDNQTIIKFQQFHSCGILGRFTRPVYSIGLCFGFV